MYLHDALCGLGLACARLAGNDDTLIVFVGLHVVEGSLRNGEDVRRDLETVASLVFLDDLFCVDSEIAEWIYAAAESEISKKRFESIT